MDQRLSDNTRGWISLSDDMSEVTGSIKGLAQDGSSSIPCEPSSSTQSQHFALRQGSASVKDSDQAVWLSLRTTCPNDILETWRERTQKLIAIYYALQWMNCTFILVKGSFKDRSLRQPAGRHIHVTLCDCKAKLQISRTGPLLQFLACTQTNWGKSKISLSQ